MRAPGEREPLDAFARAALITCLAVGLMIVLAAGALVYLFADALTS